MPYTAIQILTGILRPVEVMGRWMWPLQGSKYPPKARRTSTPHLQKRPREGIGWHGTNPQLSETLDMGTRDEHPPCIAYLIQPQYFYSVVLCVSHYGRLWGSTIDLSGSKSQGTQ